MTGGVSLELAFVLAPRQNLFFQELVEALRHEVAAQGVPASVHVGNFPPPRPELVYVMVPPHEYFTILDGRHGPLPEVLKQRTMFICCEQPDTPFFDSNVELAPRGGRVFDINRYAVREFARRGIEAEHLQLGWTPGWDHLNEGERDIDILFLGAASERRNRALASYAQTFIRRRAEIVLSDNSRPNWAASGSFHDDERKWDLMRRAKVILNIHQGTTPYFEWLRIIQAISCGAVVVSEYSLDFEPLVAGEHLLMGDLGSLHLLCERVLDDPHGLWEIRSAAYDTVHDELRLADAATRLITGARELVATEPIRETRHRFFTQSQPDPDELPFFKNFEPARRASDDQDAAWTRRALKDLRLEMLDLRRSLARIERLAAGLRPHAALEQVAQTPAYDSAAPRVSVLTALYNHAAQVTDALSSAAASEDTQLELIVVDDGSSDGSDATVLEWLSEHQDIPARLLRHPVNLGLAATRNHALSIARGELCFVLDADNEVFPSCLSRLQRAIDANPDAAFAYSYLEMFTGSQSVGLVNQFPWEPERLRFGNYIDAMALLRTTIIRDEVGGYPTDRRLYGWEDYALWCALASAGHHAIRVPEILARYRVADHSMLSLTNISTTDAFSVLIGANPGLMAGLTPPGG